MPVPLASCPVPRPQFHPTAAAGQAPVLTTGTEQFLTRSTPFLQAIAQLERYARHEVPILIEGESGTGKTLLARHVHRSSPRAAGPFREVPLSALDDTLAGSELFGHVPGAFTDAKSSRQGHFASAAGGTLFLDEIGKASVAVQKKLLVAIERAEICPLGADRFVPVNVRVVAASNIPLAELVSRESFLPDLYARLESFAVMLPPLRKRRADIPHLVEHFVARYAGMCGYTTGAPVVDPALMELLQTAPWPHNVRQLEGTIRRLLIDAEGAPVLSIAHCPPTIGGMRVTRMPSPDRGRSRRPAPGVPIVQAGESKAEAARRWGYTPTTIKRWLEEEAAERAAAGMQMKTDAEPEARHDGDDAISALRTSGPETAPLPTRESDLRPLHLPPHDRPPESRAEA